jgi:hypothetical protein
LFPNINGGTSSPNSNEGTLTTMTAFRLIAQTRAANDRLTRSGK